MGKYILSIKEEIITINGKIGNIYYFLLLYFALDTWPENYVTVLFSYIVLQTNVACSLHINPCHMNWKLKDPITYSFARVTTP